MSVAEWDGLSSGDHPSRPGLIGYASLVSRGVAMLDGQEPLPAVRARDEPRRNVRVLAVGKLGPVFERVDCVAHAGRDHPAPPRFAWPDIDDEARPAGGTWFVGRHATQRPNDGDMWVSTYFAQRLGGDRSDNARSSTWK